MCPAIPTSPRIVQRPAGEGEPQLARALRRPRRLEPPRALVRVQIRLRPRRLPGKHDDRRLPVDAVVGVAQPPVEPADHLVDVIDPRPGDRAVRLHVAPRPHQQPLRHLEMLEQPERRAAVEVAPAADDHRRHADPVVVRPHRALPPERPVRLLLDRPEPRHQLVDPPQPLLAPSLAGQRRHRRQRVHRHHEQRVAELDGLAHAAGEVDVVGVAVVRRVDRDDRLQRRRRPHPHVQRCEAGVGRAEHADGAGAPLLGGQPLDHRAQVVGLARRVLGHGDAVRRAGAPGVQPADGVVALVAQPPVVVRPDRDVVLAVRVRLDQRRPGTGRLRKVKGGRQSHAVGHRDEDVRLRTRAESLGTLRDPSGIVPRSERKGTDVRRRKLVALAATAAVIVLAAGCGGGSSSDDSGGDRERSAQGRDLDRWHDRLHRLAEPLPLHHAAVVQRADRALSAAGAVCAVQGRPEQAGDRRRLGRVVGAHARRQGLDVPPEAEHQVVGRAADDG